MALNRCKIGDIVRLYGYCGTFEVQPTASRFYDFYAAQGEYCGGFRAGFSANEKSIVEVNGEPCPLLSCPIAPPAADYPHKPQFDYSDGPQSNADQVIDLWSSVETVEQ